MGGIFGTISKKSCVADLFYGTDYNSHLGTRRGGLATFSKEKGFVRSIHNLESSYFRTKFEPSLDKFEGSTSGIGVISDTDAQPLIMNSHLGRFAICTVAKILNIEELTKDLLDKNMHFAEMSSGKTNPTELIALLIIQGKTFKEGIKLCLISPEIIPIEFIDAIPSGKPHISLSVLQNIHDSILRKSLLGRIMGKDTLRLCSGR